VPTPNLCRHIFMNTFATILAYPHFYNESIAAWNNNHPSRQFIPVTPVAWLEICRMDLHPSQWRNLCEEDVMVVMIMNGILPSWVAHGYLYGVQNVWNDIQVEPMNAPHYVDIDVD
jgi:hypothetical protein